MSNPLDDRLIMVETQLNACLAVVNEAKKDSTETNEQLKLATANLRVSFII